MKIECAYKSLVDPQTLRPHPLNPNEHGDDQIAMFVEILKYQGWRRPITVSNRSGYITKGHGALQAALAAGCTVVPIDYQDYTDEAQELADIVADNQLQRMSQMKNIKLQEIITNLSSSGFLNLELTGLKMDRIESLMTTVPGFGNSEHSHDFSLQVDPHADHWQTDIERSRKEVDSIESNTDGIIATIKILCPQPMVAEVKARIQEFLENTEFVSVSIA